MKKIIQKIFNQRNSGIDLKKTEAKKNETRPVQFNNGQTLSDTQWETITNSLSNYWEDQIENNNEKRANNNDNILNVNNKADSQNTKKYYQCTIIQNETDEIQDLNLEECLNILPILLDFNGLEANTQAEIINEIRTAYNDGLTDVKLASNLYWKYHTIIEGDRVVRGLKNKKIYGTAFKDDSSSLKIKLDEPLKSTNETVIELRGGYNKIVDPSLQLNWNFIAANALNYIHNNMQLLSHEEDARNSDIYYIYHCSSPCDWCKEHGGTIARLLPRELIDNNIDELSHYIIKDPHAKIAIWFNKNNSGLEEYRLCAFPHSEDDCTCGFELLSINLETQEYDSDFGRVVDKVPESLRRYGLERDKSFLSKEYKESKKPTFIGDNLVKFYDSVYESVNTKES